MERFLVKKGINSRVSEEEEALQVAAMGEQEKKLKYANETIFRNKSFRPHQKVS
jgi:hypothetical protein